MVTVVYANFTFQGVCIKETADYVEHLWKIFENLDSSSFWAFVDSNIVFVVIIASLIVWIPCSLLVHFVVRFVL